MYIIASACISAQKTFDGTFWSGDVVNYKGNRYTAIEPAYGKLIPAGLLRRMGKAVRMGVGAGLPLIQQNPELGGIILGTANGGLEDCLKFLNQIVDYNEGTLTPTNFVQSTPNAVAGNLALISKTTSYNTTHVHKGLAFENAMLDALLLLQENSADSVLLGSVDEISEYNYNIDYLNGYYKTYEANSQTVLTDDTPGSVCGEAAVMFVVNRVRSDQSLAQIVDVDQLNQSNHDEVVARLNYFLERNEVNAEEIDVLLAGYSGDNRTDYLYDQVRERLFPAADVYTFKNVCGDYPTATAFATWLGAGLLTGEQAPAPLVLSETRKQTKPGYVLIYNHYQGTQHSFILLKAV
ncbi:MAG TPA: beta-ketoacyl synthase chain length factor [Dyadobacter sp.]|jgi:3-oxoacyl-(acyl-carrier-protein) synthase|nr:beta-ketoacyl synthase chain length factor [Dyadobacter sp.]